MNGSAGRTAWRGWAAIPALLAALAGTAAVAGPESPAITRMLGSGVHAYFSGDFLRSYEDLSAAVEAGSRDPRVLYFRGLAAVRLGRFDEAEADFSRGADLEAAGAANWPVPQSLERVQGCDRLRLERHRARARVARLQTDLALEADRYSGIMGRQEDVLRGRRPAPATGDGAGGNLFDDDAEPVLPEPANGGGAETIPPPRAPQLEPEQEPEAAEAAPAGEPAMEDESAPTADAEAELAPAPEPGPGTDPQPGIDPLPESDPVTDPAPGTEPAPGAGGAEPMEEGETVPADGVTPEPVVEEPPAAGGLEIPEAAPGAEGDVAPEPGAEPVEPMAEEGAPAAEGQ